MFLVGTERKEKKSWLLNERKKKVIYINGALKKWITEDSHRLPGPTPCGPAGAGSSEWASLQHFPKAALASHCRDWRELSFKQQGAGLILFDHQRNWEFRRPQPLLASQKCWVLWKVFALQTGLSPPHTSQCDGQIRGLLFAEGAVCSWSWPCLL